MKQQNPYKLVKTIKNGSLVPEIQNGANWSCDEPNGFLKTKAAQGYTYFTLRVFAIMLMQYLWYCILLGIDYLDLKDFKGRFRDTLQGFIIWLERDGKKSPRRIKEILQVVFAFYRSYFLKTGNDALLIYIDSILGKNKRPNIFTDEFGKSPNYRKIKDEDLILILKAANNQRDQLILILICVLSMLPTEVLRLKWDDLRPSDNLIIINGPTVKTCAAYRIVPASDDIFDLFEKYKEELVNNGRLNFEYIFVSRVGPPTPIKYDAVMSLLRFLSRKTKLICQLRSE